MESVLHKQSKMFQKGSHMETLKVSDMSLPIGQVFVKQCGLENCLPGHRFGPAVRDHYLLHYIVSGEGIFHSVQGDFPVHAGQGFIIFPGEITTYEADNQNPWAYGWVGYSGHDAASLTKQIGLTKEAPVFSAMPTETVYGVLKTLVQEISMLRMGYLAALGGLYRFLSLIAENKPQTEQDPHHQYYEKARWFMEGNYDKPILVSDIASFVGLSRTQLFRVFIEVCGVSPKASLTEIRMQKALVLVEAGELRQEEMASSLGLLNGAQFVRMFRQTYGFSPRQWRKQRQGNLKL
jgi:AraC-like DNA-binding protein